MLMLLTPCCEMAGSVISTYHLQQGQVSQAHVVEVDFDVDPSDLVGVQESHAVALVVHHTDLKEVPRGGVDAPVVLPCEEVHPHDAEYQPEDEADQQDVHDGGDGTQQGVYHHLQGEAAIGSQKVLNWIIQPESWLRTAPPKPKPFPLAAFNPTDLEASKNQQGWIPSGGHQQGTSSAPTLMPSNLDRARRGLSALSVRRDLMAPSSEYPNQLAVRLTRETWKEQPEE